MYKVPNKNKTLKLLQYLLERKDPKDIAEEFQISTRQVYRKKQKLNAYSDLGIEKAIQVLEEDNEIDYSKQQNCISESMFFVCHTCKFVACEKNTQGILDHIMRYHTAHPPKNIIEVNL